MTDVVDGVINCRQAVDSISHSLTQSLNQSLTSINRTLLVIIYDRLTLLE